MKFADQPELARALAPLLVETLRREGDPGAIDWMVPMPLGARRARERGYNVPLELARHVAPALGTTIAVDLLSRCRDTASQASLSREERLINLAGAFIVPRSAEGRVRGRSIALVDDVVTTGATLEAAAHALYAAGAAAIHGWVLARTPAPGEDTDPA